MLGGGVGVGVGVAVGVGVPEGVGAGVADGELTTVSRNTPLLVLMLSVMSEDTPAKLPNVPVAVGATTMVTVALLPLARDPRLQVTTLFVSTTQLPTVDDAETKFTASGKMSMTTELGADVGPLFLTPIV